MIWSKIQRPGWVLALLGVVAVSLTLGCSTQYCPSGADLETGLVAEMVVPSSELVRGESYPVSLRLKNAGSTALEFCKESGPSVGYYLPSEDRVFPIRWESYTLDSSCAERVSLAPGESLEDPLDLSVPLQIEVESADLVAWYQVSRLPPCRQNEEDIQVSSSIPVVLADTIGE
ncbi:MAG: hypothetical protein SX243_24410 [Acidobacteriota bacterium]|nr:hypothetical protein [Acidobacteriota bacterium]